MDGHEAWAISKILLEAKVNKEAMYSVLRSLWYTKEQVNFLEIKGRVFLVKFGRIEDQERILNMAPWLFDQCLLLLVPFEKNKDPTTYDFTHVPYWIRI